MAANSVNESVLSLPDEFHPPNYFPFFKVSIGKLKLVLYSSTARKVRIPCIFLRLDAALEWSLPLNSNLQDFDWQAETSAVWFNVQKSWDTI